VSDYPVDEMLDRVCRDVVDLLEVSGASVMLEDEGGDLRFLAASNDTIRQIETLQIELGEGPCLAAYRTGQVVAVPDLNTDRQFRRFSPRAQDTGMRAVHSFPLVAATECIGALNLYTETPEPGGPDDHEIGLLLADICTTYILNSKSLSDSYKLAGQLQRALDSRVVIEQANGMLAQQLRLDVGEAFEILRRHARSNGRKLHEVAAEVVAGSLKLSGAS
jgi:GAF domain-containing protein